MVAAAKAAVSAFKGVAAIATAVKSSAKVSQVAAKIAKGASLLSPSTGATAKSVSVALTRARGLIPSGKIRSVKTIVNSIIKIGR